MDSERSRLANVTSASPARGWAGQAAMDAGAPSTAKERYGDTRVDRRDDGCPPHFNDAFGRLADVRQLDVKLLDLLWLYCEFLRRTKWKDQWPRKDCSHEERWQA